VLAVIGFAASAPGPQTAPDSHEPRCRAILSAIALLMLTHFACHAFAPVRRRGRAGFFISDAVADGLRGSLSPEAAGLLSETKLVDPRSPVVVSSTTWPTPSTVTFLRPANIYFRNLGQRGVLPKLNLEADDMAQTGVVSEWKILPGNPARRLRLHRVRALFELLSANKTGKPLSPIAVVHDLRDDLKTRMPDRGPLDDIIERFQHGNAAAEEARTPRELIGGRTSEEVLWSCTTVGLPRGVPGVHRSPGDHPGNAAQSGADAGKMPGDLVRTFKNLEQNGNPWGLGADRRMDWAEGHSIPTLDEKPDAEWLLW